MDEDLPKPIHYWMTSNSKHDCFFQVGPEAGPKVRFGAIKIFLIGQSEVIRNMLEKLPSSQTVDISVTDSDSETFRTFLICIYGGIDIVARNLPFEKLLNLLYLCEKYLTLDMRERLCSCFLQMHQRLSVDKVFMALSNPTCLESKRMTEAILKEIKFNTTDIVYHESFMGLDARAIKLIVQDGELSIPEVLLWRTLLKWAEKKTGSKDSADLRSCLEGSLQHIRFCSMTSDDFCRHVIGSNVLTQEEVFEVCKSIGSAKAPTLTGLCREMSPRMVEGKFTDILKDISALICPQPLTIMKTWGYTLVITPIRENNSLCMIVECTECRISGKYQFQFEFKFEFEKETGKMDCVRKSFFCDFNGNPRIFKTSIAFLKELKPDQTTNVIQFPVKIVTTVKKK